MFVDRERELDFLNHALARENQGQMILLYGRRRVGKTELLRHWAMGSGLPYTYWMADKEPPALQRRKLFDVPLNRAVDFAAWSDEHVGFYTRSGAGSHSKRAARLCGANRL